MSLESFVDCERTCIVIQVDTVGIHGQSDQILMPQPILQLFLPISISFSSDRNGIESRIHRFFSLGQDIVESFESDESSKTMIVVVAATTAAETRNKVRKDECFIGIGSGNDEFANWIARSRNF